MRPEMMMPSSTTAVPSKNTARYCRRLAPRQRGPVRSALPVGFSWKQRPAWVVGGAEKQA